MKIIFEVISTVLEKSISYYKWIDCCSPYDRPILRFGYKWQWCLKNDIENGKKKLNISDKVMGVENDDIGDEWRFTSDSGKSRSRKPHGYHHVTSALVGSRSNNMMMTMIHVSEDNDHCKLNHASSNYRSMLVTTMMFINHASCTFTALVTTAKDGRKFIRVWWTTLCDVDKKTEEGEDDDILVIDHVCMHMLAKSTSLQCVFLFNPCHI